MVFIHVEQDMICTHGDVDAYIESIKDYKEVLSDPNKHLSGTDIRMGKGIPIKVLSKKENYHEKLLLGNLYEDKEFLRYFQNLLSDTIVSCLSQVCV